MAASSNSDDASDIFWPGYVDAISNLAINLLFVIAVMAIVVIGATLQINELLKRKDRALADDVSFSQLETDKTLQGSGKSTAKSSTSAESQQQNAFSTGTTDKQTESPNAGVGERKSSAGESEQRTEQLAQKLSQALSQAQSLARQAQTQSQSQSQSPSQAQAQAQAQAKQAQTLAQSLAQAESIAKSLAQAQSQSSPQSQAQSQQLAKALAEALAQAQALAKLTQAQAQSSAQAASQSTSTSSAQSQATAQAQAQQAQQAQAQSQALTQSLAQSLAQAQALAKAIAAAQAQAQAQAQTQAQSQSQSQQENEIKELKSQLQEAQQQLRSTQAQLNEAKQSAGKAQSASGSSPKKVEGVVGSEEETGRVEIVNATQTTPAPTGTASTLVVEGGVVVNFGPDSTDLSEAESRDVLAKMASFGPVATTKWRIDVVYPSGFSEARRMAFNRSSVVRNILVRNGVPGANISPRLIPSSQPTANNAQVIIRKAP